jgi:uncharacterized protein (DUF1015 family)
MGNIIKPFRATYYNTKLFKDHSDLVCPPYDVINKDQLKALRRKSPYNFSNIIIADTSDYQQKRRELDALIKREVLVDDDRECFYLYEQRYAVDRKPVVRYGVITLLRIDKKGIFPHEKTHKAPKEDRKKIIRAVEANLSPVFVIAAKSLGAFSVIYKKYRRGKPFITCKDGDGNINRLWRIDQSEDIEALIKAVSPAPLLIADGHHRFEVSHDYFKKNKGKYKDLNYILAYVTDLQKGLTILPTHRIVSLKTSWPEVLRQLKESFTVKEVSQKALALSLTTAKNFSLGIYHKGKFYFLELKNKRFLCKIKNKLFRDLDAYVFHRLVLPMFATKGYTQYSHSIKEARELAAEDKTAFLLRAADLAAVVSISRAGYRLPQKSTYFYPKLLSGLAVRRFVKTDCNKI